MILRSPSWICRENYVWSFVWMAGWAVRGKCLLVMAALYLYCFSLGANKFGTEHNLVIMITLEPARYHQHQPWLSDP
jgi:hypothetical protein